MSSSKWNGTLQIAKLQQQVHYELLPEWTKYKQNEYKYLKQNIGFALFGPPTESTNSVNSSVAIYEDLQIENCNVTNAFRYKKEAQEVIERIYNKVLEFGVGGVDKSCIYFGIILNMTIDPPIPNLDIEKNDAKKVEASESEKEAEEKEEVNLFTIPIFKILTGNSVWYIDIHGRVYKSWKSYKEENTLPMCTMVLPMDGNYKADPTRELTEESSSVWLEILESPACSKEALQLKMADATSSAFGIVGLGLSVATLFTPAAPVALGALATTGVSSLWATGRAVQNLVNRYKHEESINVTNRNAFCSWLTITGSAFGLAQAGGNVAINRLVQNGNIVGNAHRMTYNALVIGNLTVNGFGVAWQGYCMYDKYQNGEKIGIMDILSFGTHVLFFGNAVINMQFAGDLIESTQGRIVDDYKAMIRSRNLRKKFNRAKRIAAENNTDKIAENAEIIRYINRKQDWQMGKNMNAFGIADKNIVLLDNGTIKICGYSLLDPIKFVKILIEIDRHLPRRNDSNGPSTSRQQGNSEEESMGYRLKDSLLTLLSNFSQKYKTTNLPDIDQFNTTIDDMKYMKNALIVFDLIFQMAVSMINHNRGFEEYIGEVVHFIWCYVKESLRTNALTAIFSISDLNTQKALEKILQYMLHHSDALEQRLRPAVEEYINEYLGTFCA